MWGCAPRGLHPWKRVSYEYSRPDTSSFVSSTLETSSVSIPEPELPANVYGVLRTDSSEEVTIGKGQFVKGKISGTGPLFIDGRVEGDIDIPNERVTIGEHGVFVAHARKDSKTQRSKGYHVA